MLRAGLGYLFACLLVGAPLVYWVYQTSLEDDLDALAAAGRIRVEQAAERLTIQLGAYRVLVNALARDPRIVASLSDSDPGEPVAGFLKDQVLTYGAERIVLIDRDGRTLASSDPADGIGAGPGLAQAALNGRLGFEHGLDGGQRRFRLSRGVSVGQPPPAGAVLLSVDIAALEFEWAVVPEAIAFFDQDGLVFVSNRPSLLLKRIGANPSEGGIQAEIASGGRAEIGDREIWRFDGGPDLPREALVVAQPVPQLGMTAKGFLDTFPAREQAALRAMFAAAVLGLVALAGLIVMLWRRRLADRLAIEAAANARLEARVEARTAELRDTQDQLIQAGKMTALGQMSAGITHELNQPLATIMNFAENGGRLLDADRPRAARENFSQIVAQIHRIDRIVRHLRGFARNEAEPVEPTDFGACVAEALTLSDASLRKAGIAVDLDLPRAPVIVAGGKVRLQQVIVNLIANAVDAMAETEERRLSLSLETRAGWGRLVVRDSGPGIADPSRVFDPFYTTKELGASKGLGLGLSISYGIVGGFGGEISAANHPGGGAIFVITVPLAEPGTGQGEPT